MAGQQTPMKFPSFRCNKVSKLLFGLFQWSIAAKETRREHDDVHTGHTQHDNCRTLLCMDDVDDVIVGTQRGNIKKY
jgi:hypothetical protein